MIKPGKDGIRQMLCSNCHNYAKLCLNLNKCLDKVSDDNNDDVSFQGPMFTIISITSGTEVLCRSDLEHEDGTDITLRDTHHS